MDYGVLVDPSRCIGCRACQVACKRWNNRQGTSTRFSNEWTNPLTLSYDTYTHIRFKLENDKTDGKTNWRFFNWRCMNCKDPACVPSCPVDAITKYEEGPVVINQDRCIGCKFCVSACPFEIPKYDPSRNKVDKCHMCYDRIPQKEPACVQACPTDALQFDTREAILQKAVKRAEKLNGNIYGDIDKKPLGGTSFIYVLDAEPSVFGLPEVGERPSLDIPLIKQSKWLLLPAAVGGLFYLLSWRKRRMQEKEE